MENNTVNIKSVGELQKNFEKFGVADYVVFVLMLVGCSAVGVYYAWKSKSQEGGDEAAEYLMGGRKMQVFPISLSLIASFTSGITLLGLPTEIYIYGINYLFTVFAYLFAGILSYYFILPVFHNRQLSSTYEYLNLRFDHKVRLLSSTLFVINQLAWLPLVIYVPALAFNQVTGVNIHIITPCVCVVCIFYTCIGGLKAVVWTDVIQTFLMIGSLWLLIIKGTIDVGGFGTVWTRNWETDRLTVPPFSLDPTIQTTVFSLTIGGTVLWTQNAVLNQNMIQRFLTLPTIKLASRAMVIYILGIIFLTLSCGYIGLLAFSAFYNCDPLTTGLAKAKDQMVPLLVTQILGDYPGMPGIFVAGVFSAALRVQTVYVIEQCWQLFSVIHANSLSTGLNSLSAVVLEDFIKPYRKTPMSNRMTILILKSVVVLFGVICVILVYIIEQMGTVLHASNMLEALAAGPAFGVIFSGLLLPFVNAKGALWGGIVGLCSTAVLVVGFSRAKVAGAIVIPTKPIFADGCTYEFEYQSPLLNSTANEGDASNVFILYRLCFLWYTFIGTVITVFVATIISYATGGNDFTKLDPYHFSPAVRKWLPSKMSMQEPEQKQLLKILTKNEEEDL